MQIVVWRKWIALGITCLGAFSCIAQTDSSTFRWKFLPESHLVPIFTADARSHHLSIAKPTNDNGYNASMGGVFPLIAYNRKEQSVQFSAASTLYTTLRRWTDHGLVVNADYFVDFFLDFKLNKHWTIRSGIGHTSQHLVDDAIQAGMAPIQYTRDYSQLFGVYTNQRYQLMTYGGMVRNDNLKTNKDFGIVWMFQLGFEHAPIHWFEKNFIYYAADWKFRGESNYQTIQNYQIGYRYGNWGQHVFRFAAVYTTGMDERGQFYQNKRDFFSMGTYFDF